MRPRKSSRGFTIVEMLTSMTIMGIVLALAVIEFAMVFKHNNLTSANLTAEANARIALSKVTNEMRQAMPDVTDQSAPYTVVVSPTAPPPSTAPGTFNAITYYRVDSGSAGLNASPMPTNTNGDPVPCYDLVTLQWDSSAKTIKRTIQLVNNLKCPSASTTNDILAYNVAGFTVSAISASLFDVDIQTTATSGNYGIYDLNTQVALGYTP